jgi:catalase
MPLPTDPKLSQLSKDLLEVIDAAFGVHPGYRAVHAKGILLTGTFTPTRAAGQLSRAPHFQRPTPIFARFSNSTGVPLIPDPDPNANPRGLAVRFRLGDHVHTDIISHAANGFPSKNGEEFLEFLRAVVASMSSQASPSPIEAYVGSHPAALAFVQLPKPTPTSFAREAYYGLTAHRFINQAGQGRHVRYRFVPDAGTEYLDDPAAKAKSPTFLHDEIVARIAQGPVGFKLLAQLANPGDTTDNVTVAWPAERELVELGHIRLEAIAPDNAREQQHQIYDPIARIDGVEASEDPLLEVRAAAYLLSGRRRRAAPPTT